MEATDTICLRLFHRIKELAPSLESQGVINSTDTFEYLGLDSLDMVELIIWAEEEFYIDIEDAKFFEADIKTVGAFAQFIEKQCKGNGAS